MNQDLPPHDEKIDFKVMIRQKKTIHVRRRT